MLYAATRSLRQLAGEYLEGVSGSGSQCSGDSQSSRPCCFHLALVTTQFVNDSLGGRCLLGTPLTAPSGKGRVGSGVSSNDRMANERSPSGMRRPAIRRGEHDWNVPMRSPEPRSSLWDLMTQRWRSSDPS